MPGWCTRTLVASALSACLLQAPLLSPAQADEELGASASESTPSQLQPRASVHSERFELVVLKAEEQLLLFLDDFASNVPVAGASLEVKVEGRLGALEEIAPGLYALDWKAPAGKETVEIAVAIETEGEPEELSASLMIPPAAAEPQRAAAPGFLWPDLPILSALLILVLGAGCAFFALRHRGGLTDNRPEKDKARAPATAAAQAPPASA